MPLGPDRPDLTYYTQYFEDALGVQYKQTPLTAKNENFTSLQNIQFGQGYSLEGVKGFQPVGQPSRFNKIFTYSYLDATTGSTKNELLGMNRGLWVLNEVPITVTRTSGVTPWNWRVRLNSGLGLYVFELVDNGTVTFTRNLTPPTIGLSAYTIYNLVDDFNAAFLGSFSMSFTAGSRFQGRFNGNQTVAPVGGIVTLNVNSTIYDFASLNVLIYNSTSGAYEDLPVWSYTATTLNVVSSASIQVLNGQFFGDASVPVSGALRVQDAPLTTVSPKINNFSVWRRVPSSLDALWTSGSSPEQPFVSWHINQNAALQNEALPASVVNAQQGCYILAPAVGQGVNEGSAFAYEGYPWRYDGRFVCRAGLPQGRINSVVPPGLGGDTTDLVKFIVVPKLRDYRGVVIRGPASAPFTVALKSIPTSANYVINITSIRDNTGFYTIGARVNGAGQAVPGTVNVIQGHKLRVGDVVQGTVTGISGFLAFSYTVTATTPTTVTLAGPAGTLATTQQLSPLTWEVYATQVNGVDYYLAAEYPNDPNFATNSVGADTGIFIGGIPGPRYEQPELTYEPFPPPRASVMAIHDGAIVLGAAPSQPNSIFWSRPGTNPSSNIESFPPLNTAVIPSSVEGAITALFSDTGDRLIVGKPAGHYEVVGNIHNRNIGVNIKREGDWGFASQSSVVKIDGVVYGVCSLGVYTVHNGNKIEGIAEDINPIFLESTTLNLKKAIASNDRANHCLRVYVPVLPTVSDLEPTTGAIDLSMDYINQNIWQNRLLPRGMQPSADIANFQNATYHCSGGVVQEAGPVLPGIVYRQLSLVTDYSQNFAFYNQAIAYTIDSNFLHDGRPSFDKLFLQLKFWLLYLPFESFKFVPCTYTVQVFRDFNATTPYATTTFSIATINDFEHVIDLFEECKARAMRFRVTVNSFFQTPRVSGYEILMKAPYVNANFLK